LVHEESSRTHVDLIEGRVRLPRLGAVITGAASALPWLVRDGALREVEPASSYPRDLVLGDVSPLTCRSYAYGMRQIRHRIDEHHPDLPAMSRELLELFANEPAEPDWSDRAAVIDYLVEDERPFAARSRPFDTDGMRAVAERVVERTADIAAQLTNPYLIDAGEPWRGRLGQVGARTLVLHGTEDPLFPTGHGRALAAEIPGARLTLLEQVGHEVFPRHQWDIVIPAVLDHTAAAGLSAVAE